MVENEFNPGHSFWLRPCNVTYKDLFTVQQFVTVPTYGQKAPTSVICAWQTMVSLTQLSIFGSAMQISLSPDMSPHLASLVSKV